MRKILVLLTVITTPFLGFSAQITQSEADILMETVVMVWEKDHAENSIQTAKEFYTPTEEKIQKFSKELREKWIKKSYDDCLCLWLKERLEEEE